MDFIEQLLAEIHTLKQIIKDQEERITTLETHLKQDSHNSNKPPSSDGSKRTITSIHTKSNRSSGGQQGHKGSTLEMNKNNRKDPKGKNGTFLLPTIETATPSIKKILRFSFPYVPFEIVDDAVSDSVCNYLEKAPQHVQESSIQTRSWLYKTSRRCLLREICIRKKFLLGLNVMENDDALNSPLCFLAPFKSHESVLSVSPEEKQIDTITIEEILEYLSPKTKSTFQKILSGLSMTEIAVEEGCSLKTINKRFERGCAYLKEIWKTETENLSPYAKKKHR